MLKVENKSHMVGNVESMLLPGAACVSHWQPVLPFAPVEVSSTDSIYQPVSVSQWQPVQLLVLVELKIYFQKVTGNRLASAAIRTS